MISQDVIHWFIVPVVLCGTLIGSDGVKCIFNRIDLFDPIGVIGIVGVHFFFLAPLLHVSSDYWMQYVLPPPDWRDWLGWMANLNLVSLIAYRYFRVFFGRHSVQSQQQKKILKLDWNRFKILITFSLLLSGALQVAVYAKYGGILGYIAAYETHDAAVFEGMGWIFMMAESFPILIIMAYAVYVHNKKKIPGWLPLTLVLVAFLILKILFGGLRGSRSNTVWGLFWAVGIIHFWIRPIPRKLVFSGMIFLVLFMYVYGFYKRAGIEGVVAVRNAEMRTEMETKTGRTLEGTLLGDLARSDVQAFLLYRIWDYPSDYNFACGRTFAGALALLIPQRLWSDRPVTKVKEGTEIQYGRGSYPLWISSRVYGLAGETMLNFGLIAVPFAFAFWGFAVAKVHTLMLALTVEDCRWLIVPLMIMFSFNILVSDSDNNLFFLVKNGTLPTLVVFLSSTRSIQQKYIALCGA